MNSDITEMMKLKGLIIFWASHVMFQDCAHWVLVNTVTDPTHHHALEARTYISIFITSSLLVPRPLSVPLTSQLVYSQLFIEWHVVLVFLCLGLISLNVVTSPEPCWNDRIAALPAALLYSVAAVDHISTIHSPADVSFVRNHSGMFGKDAARRLLSTASSIPEEKHPNHKDWSRLEWKQN